MNNTDAVKEFNIRSKDGSKSSGEAFKALGMDGAKMSQIFAKGGPEAQASFKKVVAAISSIKDPVKKNAVGVGLFGTQFEDLEKDVVAAMGTARSQFDMSKDTMGEMSKIKFNSVGEGFKQIGRQLLTGFVLPIGDFAIPAMQKFSGFASKAIPAIQNGFAKIGSTVGPVISQIGGDIAWLFENGFDGEMEGVTVNYAKALGMSDGDAEAIAIKVRNVFEQMTGFKDQLIEGWKTILPHVQSIFGSIGSVIKQVVPVVAKIGVTFFNAASKIVQALIPVVTYLTGKIWPVISQIFNFLSTQVFPKLMSIISSLLTKISGIATSIGQAFTAIFNFVKPILDALFIAFQVAFPAIKAVVMAAVSAIGGVISGLLTTIGGVIDFVTGVFSGNWSKAWQGVRDIFSGIFSSLGSILAAPINAVINLINEAIRKINGISVEIPDWVPGMGGEKFGVNIPEIPNIGGYADGGIVSSPEIAWVGEGGDKEVIIPINNSKRSQGLYETAGRMLGQTPATPTVQASGGGDFIYRPTFIIQGNADQTALQQMDERNRSDFSREFKEYKRQIQRVSFA
ncbi:hypothetical protein [Paenibacillus sp. FJAT-26967]|uniref:hypothetical protein n=1 Tax=Paenibacillus sp. FJAT-26967 TaxID=1729690 RepID=UPI000837D937|nr:hypothetical protein [Paenibacillus sp. FJAT-26967]